MTKLEDLPQMNLEWEVWQRVCFELRKCGVDINEEHYLVNAITRWGEELVALRLSQDPEVTRKALEEHRAKYTLQQER